MKDLREWWALYLLLALMLTAFASGVLVVVVEAVRMVFGGC